MIHTGWITAPFTEIADKGRGVDLLGKIMNLVLNMSMKNGCQVEM